MYTNAIVSANMNEYEKCTGHFKNTHTMTTEQVQNNDDKDIDDYLWSHVTSCNHINDSMVESMHAVQSIAQQRQLLPPRLDRAERILLELQRQQRKRKRI
jgi:hypothetical protein